MSASTWLVPLNVHQSLSLRTVAKNSRQLENISTSIHELSTSLQLLENSAFKIAGNTKNILALLESKEHRDTTIAAMRKLIFRHHETCSEAMKEEDKLTAISSCIISESLLYQEWFNIDLFSHISFEEMAKVDEMMRNSSDFIENIRTQLSEDESLMVGELPFFLERIKAFEIKSNDLQDLLENFLNIYEFRYSLPSEKRYQVIQIGDAHFRVVSRELIATIRSSVKRIGIENTVEKIIINERAIEKLKMDRSKLGGWGASALKKDYDEILSRIVKFQHGLHQIKAESHGHSNEIRDINNDFEKTFKGRLFLDNL